MLYLLNKLIYFMALKLPENLIIDTEFKKAYDLMETTYKHVYVTGKAGTGKSTLLTYFRENTKKNFITLAPTGIAAVNIDGATIHSFFRFAPQLVNEKSIIKDTKRKNLFKKLETIIIDEISMVRADILDGIDKSLRINKENNLPFGGVQMVFFGDLYQLPPVVIGKDQIDYFEQRFGGIYFFNAKVFQEINLEYIELKNIFRQKDDKFKDILNNVREKTLSYQDLSLLNQRLHSKNPTTKSNLNITLSATNKVADFINRQKIDQLETDEYLYEAIVDGKFERSAYPTEENLVLKEGAQIMMLKNDSSKRWANGTLGVITKLSDVGIQVEINGKDHTVTPEVWEVIEFQYNQEENKIEEQIIGSFTQYPIRLAWAITIHKSQGQTFENIIIDLGYGAFTHGQTYVALSRCTTLEGIVLKKPIRHQDIILDKKIIEFVTKYNQLN